MSIDFSGKKKNRDRKGAGRKYHRLKGTISRRAKETACKQNRQDLDLGGLRVIKIHFVGIRRLEGSGGKHKPNKVPLPGAC